MPKHKKKTTSVLTWVEAPLRTCLSSGKPVRVREAELTLLGPKPVTYALDLGYCPESGRWYALLEDLDALLAEEGWRVADMSGFEVDGAPVEPQVFFEKVGQSLPWPVFQEATRRMEHEAGWPPPPEEAVRALPALPETWEACVRAAVWVGPEGETPQLGYLTLVVDAQGLVRSSDVTVGTPPEVRAMAGIVRKAAGAPVSGLQPGRPRQLRVAGEARALGEALAAAGIPVVAGPTPLADEALAAASAHLRRSDAEPSLTGCDEAEIRAFFRVARTFYRAKPWKRFDGDRYVAFRIDDDAWHYASVMGQMRAEPGLSLFESWHQLCRFLHNQPSVEDLLSGEEAPGQLAATGGLEGMTLVPLEAIHPEDGAYLMHLGLAPAGRDSYPLPQRFTEEGPERSHFPLSTYRRLMEALLDVLKKRRTPVLTSIKQTVRVDDLDVAMRYPADGLEPMRPGATSLPGYRLVLEGRKLENQPRPPVPEGSRLVIDAPGEAKVYDVALALKRAQEGIWVRGLGAGETYLWSDAYPRKEPSPSICSLEGLDDLWIELVMEIYPVRLLPRAGQTESEIRIRMER